jgi:hypothetical protein
VGPALELDQQQTPPKWRVVEEINMTKPVRLKNRMPFCKGILFWFFNIYSAPEGLEHPGSGQGNI